MKNTLLNFFQPSYELYLIKLKYNLGVVKEAEQRFSAAAKAYFDAGNLSLKQNNLNRLYRSFSSLKKLSVQNTDAQKKYLQLASLINTKAKN